MCNHSGKRLQVLQEELEAYDGVPSGKYTSGLGQVRGFCFQSNEKPSHLSTAYILECLWAYLDSELPLDILSHIGNVVRNLQQVPPLGY